MCLFAYPRGNDRLRPLRILIARAMGDDRGRLVSNRGWAGSAPLTSQSIVARPIGFDGAWPTASADQRGRAVG